MKFLTFGFLMFVSFSIFADCAGGLELWLEVIENQPGKVIIGDGGQIAYFQPKEKIYRARKIDSLTWGDIHEFTFLEGAYEEIGDIMIDHEAIAQENCVPAGEWTYIVPLNVSGSACSCDNFESITVPEYSSDCVNTSHLSDITSTEFEEMKKFHYFQDEVGNESPDNNETVLDDDIAEADQIDSDSNETGNTNDNDIDSGTKETGFTGERVSSGCSILVF